ncbi:hypothetical protein V6N12_022924 [Hibiscus sabdariffa]|uniref:FAR1 domain-containing protein n=1 Tax=Hibiscus sabdariffa TaxID=183260 RepID=A0ABR2FW60_9ROSI
MLSCTEMNDETNFGGYESSLSLDISFGFLFLSFFFPFGFREKKKKDRKASISIATIRIVRVTPITSFLLASSLCINELVGQRKSVMESKSGRGIDSDESMKCLELENFDEQELVDHELSDNIDLHLGEVDKGIDESTESLPLLDNAAHPYIGMEFHSRDAAREFYVAYGRHIGFTVRIHHNRRSRINNTVIGQDFVCSKEGFREKKYMYRKDRVLPPPPITREGCPAMLRLALRDGVKWVVTKFVKEHNHSLSPGKVPWRGSAKNLISEDEKDRRIQELTQELNNEKQKCKRRCAAYQEQLHTLLKFVEEHTDQLSRRVQDIVNNIKELEEA